MSSAAVLNAGLAATQEQYEGKALLASRYDVQDATGRRVCNVSRDVAVVILATGNADAVGRTFVKYIRLHVEVEPGSLSPAIWFGSSRSGRVQPSKYAHNNRVCNSWQTILPQKH
jgi:hypothetical protein